MAGTPRKTENDSWRLLAAVVLSLATHFVLIVLPGTESVIPDSEERHFIEIGIVEAADFASDANPDRNLAQLSPARPHQADAESPARSAVKKKDRSPEVDRSAAPEQDVPPVKKTAVCEPPAEKKVQAVPEEPVVRTKRMTETAESTEATKPERSTQRSVAKVSATRTRTQPRPLSTGNPAPRYPRLALRRGWEGEVVLRVQVSPSGNVERVLVHTSSGHELLDDSALQAVRFWRFQPARRGGQPVAAVVRVPVRFRLQKG